MAGSLYVPVTLSPVRDHTLRLAASAIHRASTEQMLALFTKLRMVELAYEESAVDQVAPGLLDEPVSFEPWKTDQWAEVVRRLEDWAAQQHREDDEDDDTDGANANDGWEEGG